MMELAVILSALSLGVSGAALAAALVGRREATGRESLPPEERSREDEERERRNELRMQEGLANLLRYMPGGEEEM